MKKRFTEEQIIGFLKEAEAAWTALSIAQHQALNLPLGNSQLLRGTPDHQAVIDDGLDNLAAVQFPHAHGDRVGSSHDCAPGGLARPPAWHAQRRSTTFEFIPSTTLEKIPNITLAHNKPYVKLLLVTCPQ